MSWTETDVGNLARALLARLSYDYGDAEDFDPEVKELFERGERLLPIQGVAQNTEHRHTGRFEVRLDEDTGRRFWWGGEDGWKDPTEIGENGVLTIDATHFAVGTEILLREPVNSVLPTHERIDEQAAASAPPDRQSTAS